ncbi:hypothetical protein HDU91_000468 [Kappamyces sp. JEL0680]|nr:hypothetical protein HDU91_000468 [Kappamyces sp. JEL0680]
MPSAAVVEMIKKIGSVENIDSFLENIKTSSSIRASVSDFSKKPKSARLMGFGHRIYKTTDPRVRLCKQLAFELFDLLGCNKVAQIGLKLEEKALADPWFTSRNLYPNIDFWTALCFDTLDFPSDMFPVWMFIPRVSGFIAHFVESLDDPEYKIFRPRQIYVGEDKRPYETFPLETSNPAIESSAKQMFRPKSIITELGSGFGNPKSPALSDAIEELYGELDFTTQFASEGDPKLGKRLKSWVKKRFSNSNVQQAVTDEIIQSIKDIKVHEQESRADSISSTSDSSLPLSSSAISRTDSKRGGGAVDLMAGSSHSRVIARSITSPKKHTSSASPNK